MSLLVLAVLFVAAQLVPLDRSNPPSDPQQHFRVVASPPAAVASVLDRSCRDCHSNDTTWPWYSRVAPMSFLVVDDVKEGRLHLNFSEWGKLDARRSARKLEQICDEVRSGDMPDRKYTLLHPEAKLSPADVQAICGWTEQVLAK
ncbi:MAG: hypothetical protein EHM24_09250 [Acidobacteria bacterium]|nr:MAG: hypothetical protein EHM24_09250 [Acidobacteriota bacterium]